MTNSPACWLISCSWCGLARICMIRLICLVYVPVSYTPCSLLFQKEIKRSQRLCAKEQGANVVLGFVPSFKWWMFF